MVSAAVNSFHSLQSGFQLLGLLHMTGYMSPPQARIEDCADLDFIVVGAGSAGSVVANRLTENPAVSVLLLEAGGDPPFETTIPGTLLFSKNTKYDWNYTAEPDKYVERCHQSASADITQGKMLGGTGSLNNYLYGRGNAADYDGWAAALGDDLWNWKNVLPYFIKSEKITDPTIISSAKAYHGTEGNIGVSIDPRTEDVDDYLTAMKEMGANVVPDINEDNPKGFSKMMFTVANGSRQSTAACYLYPAKDRPNLHLLKETLVTKLIIDDNNHVVGVEATTGEGKTITLKAKKEVIVSAGAINSAKLLMLSGIGPKHHLEEKKIKVIVDSPVGENLQDHVAVNMVYHYDVHRDYAVISDPYQVPAPAVVGYSALDHSQKYPDYQTMTFFTDESDDISTLFCSVALGFKDELCDHIHDTGRGKRDAYIQVITLKTKSRGYVRLRSANPFDTAMINMNYFSDKSDLDNLVNHVKDFSRAFKTSFFTKRKINVEDSKLASCGSFPYESKEYWNCYVTCMMSGLGHVSGTAALGSVLDARLCVRGVTGLRVADASVIPTLPSGNIYAPVIMIGEKAAAIIKEDHKL